MKIFHTGIMPIGGKWLVSLHLQLYHYSTFDDDEVIFVIVSNALGYNESRRIYQKKAIGHHYTQFTSSPKLFSNPNGETFNMTIELYSSSLNPDTTVNYQITDNVSKIVFQEIL